MDFNLFKIFIFQPSIVYLNVKYKFKTEEYVTFK